MKNSIAEIPESKNPAPAISPLPPLPKKLNDPSPSPSTPTDQSVLDGGFSDAEFEERFGGQPIDEPPRPAAAKTADPAADKIKKKLIDIKTGRAFRAKTGRMSLIKQLERASLSGGGLTHLGKKERKFFVKVVQKHAKNLPVGKELSRQTRMAIKRELEAERGKGTLTETDINAFKKIIDSKM